MFKDQVVLMNETGLHARPASVFVKEASKYKSSITITKDNKEYNAKSIMSVLSMGAIKDDSIIVQAEGDDAEQAVKSLIKLVKNNFTK